MDSAQAKIFAESLLGSNVGGWTIDATFGNGKSAVVFSAEMDGVKGAIKIFHPELIERYGRDVQLARIDREKSLIGQSHPHLVTILDGGACSVTGHLFVVMERLPYENLHASLSAIAPEKYGTLISQVASAARFLEDLGLAHRDIKPENIAVTDAQKGPSS
ncbi:MULTISPECIES: protein kinase [unclassified Mesorhizobium]|uniref:protein kinase domain-containing protein n=1 Tax=unclassified Mesorhizobium TaxID=325217 RepID=UPI0033374556